MGQERRGVRLIESTVVLFSNNATILLGDYYARLSTLTFTVMLI